jgi:hypothetical protein
MCSRELKRYEFCESSNLVFFERVLFLGVTNPKNLADVGHYR